MTKLQKQGTDEWLPEFKEKEGQKRTKYGYKRANEEAL